MRTQGIMRAIRTAMRPTAPWHQLVPAGHHMRGASAVTAEVHHIGEVAVAVGLSLKTIRHYDEVGVVPPSGRSAGGFRLYTDEDIERLRLVKLMKPLDFTLDEMRQLLQARDELGSEDLTVERREDLRGRLAMFAALVEQRSLRLREQLDAVEGLSSLLHQEAAAVEE